MTCIKGPKEPKPKLTARQQEVLACLVEGKCNRNRDIADALGISPHTVAAHLKAVYQAHRVTSRLDLLRKMKGE